jgi:hypothetical protein
MKEYMVELHFPDNFVIYRWAVAETEAFAIGQVMETKLFAGYNGFYYPRHAILKARAYEEKGKDGSGKKGGDLASAC